MEPTSSHTKDERVILSTSVPRRIAEAVEAEAKLTERTRSFVICRWLKRAYSDLEAR